MKEKLLEILNSAKDTDKYTVLGVAADYAESMTEDSYKEIDMIVYSLRWLIHNKRFPKYREFIKKRKIVNHTYNEQASKKAFFENLAKNPDQVKPYNSVDSLLSRYLADEKKKGETIETTKSFYYIFEFVRGNNINCLTNEKESQLPNFSIASFSRKFNDWEDILAFLCSILKPYKKHFSI